MKALQILILGLILISFSCRKDEISDFPVTNEPTPGTGAVASVNGMVLDLDLNPLPSALVTLGTESTTSDENGVFRFGNVAIDAEGSLLQVDVPGYFSNYKFVRSGLGKTAQLKLAMVPRNTSGTIMSNAAGGVISDDKVSITFPAQGVAFEDGSAYQGAVKVFYHWFDPTDEQLHLSMPGDLRGRNTNDEVVQLSTFGMMAVELESENGEKLQLAPGVQAELSFHIPDDLETNAPNEIPLWSLDDQGVWIEEGSATKVGNKYIGEVSHFSFWNCDFPFPVVDMTGRVVCDGNPIVGLTVTAHVEGLSVVGYDRTNSDGVFEGKVPADQTIIFKLLDPCGETIQEITIVTTNVDFDHGDIEIEDKSFIKRVTGKILDCDMQPLVSGYLVLNFGTPKVLFPDDQGNIDGLIHVCGDPTVEIKAYDYENIKTSLPESLSLTGSEVSFGTISTCEVPEEFMLIELEDLPPVLVEDPLFYLLNGNSIFIHGYTSLSFNYLMAEIPLLEEGTSTPTFVKTTIDDPDIPDIWTGRGGVCGEGDTGIQPCDNSVVSTIDLITAERIEGSIEGDLFSNFQGSPITRPFKVTFKIDYDRILETRTVGGYLWEDENFNGLRDPGEGYGGQVRDPGPWVTEIYPHVVFNTLPSEKLTVEPDGKWSRTNVVFEGMSNLGFGIVDGYVPTLRNVGNDETIDSDAYRYIQPHGTGFNTDSFDITLIDYEHLDIGLVQIDGSECDVNIEGCGEYAQIEVGIIGGTPPYRYVWENSSRAEPTTGLEPGSYPITVYDNAQKVSACFINIPAPDNDIELFAFEDKSGGTDNVYDAGIDDPLANVTFTVSNTANAGAPDVNESGTTNLAGNTDIENLYGNVKTQYLIEVDVPNGYELIEANVGSDLIDSDFDPTTGQLSITILGCAGRFEFFAGFKKL